MLSHLYIRNFALIEELSIPFDDGLTIITGETGAGKSILIGALGQVLGARGKSDLVRSGSEKAVIEATLTSPRRPQLDALLNEAGIEHGDEIILRREISLKGSSRCFINDSPCTLQVLRKAGDILIDLHGQHEHQLLLHQETHASMLDAFAGLQPDVADYKALLARYRKCQRTIQDLRSEQHQLREQQQLLQFQLDELDALDLDIGEEEELESETRLLENAETLFESSSSLCRELYDKEDSAFVQLSEALHQLERLAGIDRQLTDRLEELQQATSLVEELSRTFRSYRETIDFNPSKLDDLRQRQLQLQKIKKKYGRPIDELIAYRDEIAGQLAGSRLSETQIEELETEQKDLQKKLSAAAGSLRKARKEASGRLSGIIVSELQKLGIPHPEFIITITPEPGPDGELNIDGTPCKALPDGADTIEFQITTNPGEPPRPLVKTASGGEISRIMLALKTALAATADLPILVFDEIDTGISGSVAEAVGRSLKQLSALHQIISITHLPQIAAMADTHLVVEKQLERERTRSSVLRLGPDEHVAAVARLISGNRPSDASLDVAAQLIETGRNAATAP
ncbi:MAG: DNA repair protein RecN [Prosthecochloris sp.]|nr:DNA repair protein RecN [Prosthecochloris sp.]